jgi:hypothetical protein
MRSGFRVALAPGRRYERFQLARVARWVRTSDPFLYRLTPASLERGRRQGIAVERVLAFLREVTEAPLPDSLERALRRWDEKGTEARLEPAVLLRLHDRELMDQIVTSSRLKPLIQERVGPTAAQVRRQDWPEVVARLEAMGLLPEVEGLSEA